MDEHIFAAQAHGEVPELVVLALVSAVMGRAN